LYFIAGPAPARPTLAAIGPIAARRAAMRQADMAAKDDRERRRGPVLLNELVAKVIDPVIARRGFASADLIAAWPAIAGPAYADCTAPERILWPRGAEGAEPAAGVLFLKVDGPRAIFVQHELPQILERINAFLGYAAIGHIRITQGPVRAPGAVAEAATAALPEGAETELAATLSAVEGDDLRAALDRLGRGILSDRRKRT
jgi:hypothetical protein